MLDMWFGLGLGDPNRLVELNLPVNYVLMRGCLKNFLFLNITVVVSNSIVSGAAMLKADHPTARSLADAMQIVFAQPAIHSSNKSLTLLT